MWKTRTRALSLTSNPYNWTQTYSVAENLIHFLWQTCNKTGNVIFGCVRVTNVNPLNAELNPICSVLALLGAHHFLHVSRIRVKSLTLRLLMSYIYIYNISSLRVNIPHQFDHTGQASLHRQSKQMLHDPVVFVTSVFNGIIMLRWWTAHYSWYHAHRLTWL